MVFVNIVPAVVHQGCGTTYGGASGGLVLPVLPYVARAPLDQLSDAEGEMVCRTHEVVTDSRRRTAVA